MENLIRKYIIEKPDIRTQILQYLQTMRAFLYRLLDNVSSVKLSSNEKSRLEKHVVNLIQKRTDYSRPSEKKTLFKHLQLPVLETSFGSFFGRSSSGMGVSSEILMKVSPEAKGLSGRISQALSKISRKDISPEEVKKMGKKAGIALLIIAASVGITKLAKRLRQSAIIRKILDTDVNPSIIEMSRGIIRGNLRSTDKIDSYFAQLEAGILNKYQLV